MNTKLLLKQIDIAVAALSEIRKLVSEESRPSSSPKEAKRRAAAKCCTYCGEAIPPVGIDGKRTDVRGAHVKCHKAITRLIVSGVLTDEDAVAKGWLLSAEKGGRPPSPKSPAYRLMQEELERLRRKADDAE